MNPDTEHAERVEAAAQLLHARRHRAGTGHVCNGCRSEATLIADIITGRRPIEHQADS